MFSGSLKFNLDPWEVVTDERLREVLDLLGLDMDITTIITEGGSNLSLGEKQLLCLGRAILRYMHILLPKKEEILKVFFTRNSKLLILDEATSAMDVNTDTRITSLVHSQFREVTILTVAHWINTITKYDK